MCGFVGVIEKRSHFPHIKSMLDKVSHRGRDEEDFYLDGDLVMGHRRLSIIDPDNGQQPMTSGKWTVVFNGCIYNYKDLDVETETNSDTEVLVKGLDKYGIDFIKQLNGMFAFAAWDGKDLYLARDRYGIKPLYYWSNEDTFLFGSEIKSFLKHPSFKVKVDLYSLEEYFTFQNNLSCTTLFEGVNMIPQGSYMKGEQVVKYWKWDFNPIKMNLHEAKEETQRLLKQSVERQLVSDVPVGCYLSGGLDSGTIAKYAKVQTFTCGFDMQGVQGRESLFDESLDAKNMAASLGLENYSVHINKSHIEKLREVIYHLEDLRVGMCYPSYEVAKLASGHVKVCLSGAGGDELFGGYPWRYGMNKEEYFNYWNRLGDVDLIQKTDHCRLVYDSYFDKYNESAVFNFEASTFLHGILCVGDKMSMAHTLEERFPFLDNDLVDFAQKVPFKDKLVLGKGRKQGFSAPDENWYKDNKFIKGLLTDRVSIDYIGQDYVDRILSEHGKINHRLLIWSLISFEMWCREFL